MSKKTEGIARAVRDFFDSQVSELSQPEYLEVIGDVIGYMEGYEECVKEEMAVEEFEKKEARDD